MNWSRVLSGLLAVSYLIAAGVMGGGGLFLRVACFLILPMACIWYGDAMGSITGPMTGLLFSGTSITEKSPGCLVAFVGWIVLLLPIIMVATVWSMGGG